MPYHHIPVMLDEVVRYLNPSSGKQFVDCTLGGTGHARAILEHILPNGLLVGVDQDPEAVENARQVLSPYSANLLLFHANFESLPRLLREAGIDGIDGLLLDLGISRHQLDSSGRGFSFLRDEPLDMRMNPESAVTAADIVNNASEEELRRIFWTYGEERRARGIARKIVGARARAPIRTSLQLAQIVSSAVHGPRRENRIHPATRAFMALRIAVNKELEVLEHFLLQVPVLLRPGGRVAVISFHSLEDRIVKHWMKDLAARCRCPKESPRCVCGGKPRFRLCSRRAVRPSAAEVARNPLSRSARLRVAEKMEPDQRR